MSVCKFIMRIFMMFLMVASFFAPSLFAARDFRDVDFGYFDNYMNGNYRQPPFIQRLMGIAKSIKTMSEIMTAAGMHVEAMPQAAKDKLQKSYDKLVTMLDKEDDIYGKMIARGLAGEDWKVLQDEPIESPIQGLSVGALIRVSRACSNVLGKRVENDIDRVVGGLWDSIINSLVSCWNMIVYPLFNNGQEPFSVKQLVGWETLVNAAFDDIERLLKDGIKELSRGQDMTLRATGAENSASDQVALNSWRIVFDGFVRQFDFIILQIDKHIQHYEDEEIVTFYAAEIKNRLQETNQLLAKCNSLKDLNDRLSSQKGLLSALKKNIFNLFERLLDHIKVISGGAQGNVENASGSSSSRRNGLSSSSSSDDDDDFPSRFRSNL